MVQFHTVLNFSALMLCFTADLLWNFGLLGINAANSHTNVTCEACPKGTFANKSHPDCQHCADGWCDGLQHCVKCPAGHYQNTTGQMKCIPCPRGHYQKDIGQETCQCCKKGEHQDKPGQTECKKCPPGFFSGSNSSDRCISCKFGGYCNKSGCTHCEPCQPGTEADRMGAFNCTLCNQGYYKESRSFDTCQLCERGWFQVKRGQTTCKECPQGFYCPWQDSLPIKCDPNQKCPEGSFSAGPECNLMYNRDKSDKCKLSPVVYVVIVATAAVGLITAGILILRRHTRRKEQKQRLLESQYPVYTGW